MTGVVTFTIPGEPVPWARAGKNGKRHFTPPKQERYMGRVQYEAIAAMAAYAWKPKFTGPVRLTIEALYVRPASWSKARKARTFWKTSKPDGDNIGKIIKDAGNKLIWKDDAQVADLRVTKPYGDVAKVTVTVSELGPA